MWGEVVELRLQPSATSVGGLPVPYHTEKKPRVTFARANGGRAVSRGRGAVRVAAHCPRWEGRFGPWTPRASLAVERILRADVVTRFHETACADTHPSQPALIRGAGVLIICPLETARLLRNDFSLLVLRLEAGRPTDATARRSKDAVLLKRPGELRARSCRALPVLRAGQDSARREELQEANCRLQIADCSPGVPTPNLKARTAGHLLSISAFQSAILNLLSLSLLLFLAAPAAADVQLPELSPTEPITISAQAGNRWQLGVYDVWVLRGNCSIQQGNGYARSREAVLWIDRAEATQRRPHKVIAYLEGDVEVMWERRPNGPRLTDQTWFGRFFSSAGVEARVDTVAGKPDELPPIYWRGMERRSPETADTGWRAPVEPTQFMAPVPGQPATPETASGPAAPPTLPPLTPATPVTPLTTVTPMAPAAPGAALAPVPAMGGPPPMPAGVRRVSVYPRSNVPVQARTLQTDPNGHQSIAIITSGVNVIVDVEGTTIKGLGQVDVIDLVADRLVIWMAGTQMPDLNRPLVQDQRVPLEFYMEGNIEFRQGDRTIYADRMYYDVANHVGTVLNADMLTPVPSYEGKLRLHADVLQKTAENRYFAQNAFITSSRFGEPGYRLQAGDVYFEDFARPVVDPLSGQPLLDPYNNQPMIDHESQVTAANDFLFIGPVPIFYWPVLTTDLNEPAYYIRSARLRQDNVYGTQILTKWDGYQLLGVRNKPKGTDFLIDLDYLNKRGFGYGASFKYDREGMFDIPGHVAGFADFWAVQDHGVDSLGQGRMAVPPEASYRYRLFGQHRELLPYDLRLSAEFGWISDRNFLEEYYKNEWDELKDETTGIELKQLHENLSWSISADYRINDFFTQTNWLPRLDHYWLGQSLFRDAFTWYEHSSLAYAQFRPTNVPENVSVGAVTGAAGPFNFLPWEVQPVQGERFATRQEIDWPIQLGAVKVVPYALGEAAHWGQDVNGNNLDRLFGQAGVRASVPMWSVDPTFSSDLLNVHGLAHKVVFDAEFSYSKANQNFENLPLYDPLDDDSVEAFRRRFLTTTFGLPSRLLTPTGAPYIPKFDERLYALRTGLQNWVTSPSTEIAGDLTAIRLGAEQRWQTKRGPADDRHIIDWVTLDTNVTLFPDPNRDNFGTVPGLLDYDFRWHVGDRLTLVSDGIFDFFNQGQKIVSVGGFLNRPPRGSLYAGFTVLEGPIDSKILSFSYTYWMSPKWLSSFGTTFDLGKQGNIGQNFSVTRVGESFLISAGFNVDASRNSVGANLAIEPRFLSKSRLGNVGGAQIPPAGATGLE